MSITSFSIEQLKHIVSIKEQLASLEVKLAKIIGEKPLLQTTPEAPATRGPRKMSAAAKARIAAAARARWARIKGEAKAAPVAKAAKSAKPAKGGKRVLSPEGRARIIAALKKRWASRK